MKHIYQNAVFLGLIIFTSSASANKAQKLLNEGCKGCHDTSVYSRENHKTRDYVDLQRRVYFCRGPANVSWFDNETDQVVDYLNDTFYRFSK